MPDDNDMIRMELASYSDQVSLDISMNLQRTIHPHPSNFRVYEVESSKSTVDLVNLDLTTSKIISSWSTSSLAAIIVEKLALSETHASETRPPCTQRYDTGS
jgi:hypothetical protein